MYKLHRRGQEDRHPGSGWRWHAREYERLLRYADAPETARITTEEVFGPVVIINTFETEAEATAKANDTEFGLYASVYTRDVGRAMQVAKALNSGYVGINCTSPMTAHDLPFGGYKTGGQLEKGTALAWATFWRSRVSLWR